jgi:hypothetical protein
VKDEIQNSFGLCISSFTCGNKKTGLSRTIGVKKKPRKSKHAC